MIFKRISVQFKSPREANDCSSGHLREKGKRFLKAGAGAWNKKHFLSLNKQTKKKLKRKNMF